MAGGDDSEERELSSLSDRHELEIDDETNSPPCLRTSMSPESGIDLESHATDLTAKGDENTFIANEGVDSTSSVKPNEMFQFDLTNPEEVMRMLESVHLSEEDTDVLLQEAYNVNRKLRMILQKKEEEQEFSSAENALVKGPSVVMVPGTSLQSRANSNTRTMPPQSRVASSSTSSRETLFAKNAPLPPIKDPTKPVARPSGSTGGIPSTIYSAKLRRPAPPSTSINVVPTRNALSSTGPGRRVVPRPGLMVRK